MPARPPAKPSGGIGRKVGPLPVWGWGVVLVVGLGLALYLRRRASATTGPTSGAVAQQPTTGTVDTGASGVAAAPSGLDPGLESLLASTQNSLIGGFVGMADAITGLAGQEVAAGIAAQQWSESFASQTFGEALGFAQSVLGAGFGQGASGYPSGGPAAPSTPGASVPSAPSVPSLPAYHSPLSGSDTYQAQNYRNYQTRGAPTPGQAVGF